MTRQRLPAFVRAALLALALIPALLAGCAAPGGRDADSTPQNVIILFADGTAPTQWDFGRYSSRVLRQRGFATTDIVFREGVLGLLATGSANSYVTDSGAGGSALSIGEKVDNGAISVTPDGRALPTLMALAKSANKRIGLVSTAAIYDATPAAFGVNSRSRGDRQAIVDRYLALEPEVLMGGGRDFFLPSSAGGRRNDGRDVVAAFRAKGYEVVSDTTGLRAARGKRLIGLFADGDMDFELDRDTGKQPSTAEMTRAALAALSQPGAGGFVLLVENENTDTAGHANDAAALMHALWAFDEAVEVALDFQQRHPDTLILVVSDHETGGLSITYAQRELSPVWSHTLFNPGEAQLRMIGGITLSFNGLIERLGPQPTPEALDRLLAQHYPGFLMDPDLRERFLKNQPLDRNFTYGRANVLGRMVARQTGYYWGTSGHTPEPVAVGAIGPGAARFRGYQDNTDFARHLRALIEGK
jgi:alkaline phosphatase